MVKKLCSFIIIMLLILPYGQVFAENDPTAVYNLSLQDAIDMAIEHSSAVECWDINKQNYQIQLSAAQRAKKENKNTPVNVSMNFEVAFVKSGYYVEAAKAQLRLSDIEYNKILNTISYNVTQKYYTAKNTLKMCDIAVSALDRANENKAITQKKFDMGACTKLELDNADIAVTQCEANVQKCRNSYDVALDSLKIDLGIEGESTVNLTDEITVSNFIADYEKDFEKAIATRYDINGLKESADLAVTYFKTASSLSDKSTTYFTAYTNSITSKSNYNTGVKNIKLLIKSSYYSAVEAQTDTEIARQKMEFAQNTYEVNKLRYEMGMLTNMMLSASSDELASAESAYENALLTQKLAVEKYNYEIDTGI